MIKKSQEFNSYLNIYKDIYDGFVKEIEGNGIAFNKDQELLKEKAELLAKIKSKGAINRNNDDSLYINNISTACLACRKGVESLTSYISLKCHRNCYYCFNPNQEEYQCHLKSKKDWKSELKYLLEHGQKLTHVALTGGEPLLHKEETLEFFNYVKENFTGVHTRLYTSGDLLDKEYLEKLNLVSLDEIRFSVKLEDSNERQQVVLDNIALAKAYIKDVMVEMPVIPGTESEMRDLLMKLDNIGVYGVNLLEFCFPYVNLKSFKDRGLKLKYPPYKTLYNFWYAGGLAVAESEVLILKLMDFAIDNKLKIGIHYCSLENKHYGQVYNQNTYFENNDPTMMFSENDFYYKTIKVFGDSIDMVEDIFHKNNITDYIYNSQYDFIQFNPKYLKFLEDKDIEIGVSFNIMEERENGIYCRELKVEPLEQISSCWDK